MNGIDVLFAEKSRLRCWIISPPAKTRGNLGAWRILPAVMLRVVCGRMADCDADDAVAAFGEKHLPFLRRYLPYHFGVPGGRLTLLRNRINPALFSAAFTAWARQAWPARPDLVAIDGKAPQP